MSSRSVGKSAELDLPDCLPILGYGLFSTGPGGKRQAPVERNLTLAAPLSRALLAFTMEFERKSDLSLALCANVLRVLSDAGARVRDLPLLSGASREVIFDASPSSNSVGRSMHPRRAPAVPPRVPFRWHRALPR
jgi:hypothetical protein